MERPYFCYPGLLLHAVRIFTVWLGLMLVLMLSDLTLPIAMCRARNSSCVCLLGMAKFFSRLMRKIVGIEPVGTIFETFRIISVRICFETLWKRATVTELSAWLTYKITRMQLSMGLPYSNVTRWAMCIDSAVGEPFLSTWKGYLVELVRQH